MAIPHTTLYTLHHIALQSTPLHAIVSLVYHNAPTLTTTHVHCTAVYTTLHYTTLYYTTLHYTSYAMLHYNTLHYTTPHTL